MGRKRVDEKKEFNDNFDEPPPILIDDEKKSVPASDDEPPPSASTMDETAQKEKMDRAALIRFRIIGFGLAVLLVATGSVNTLAAKWVDIIKIHGKVFNHPFFQTAVMFVGEVVCLFAYLIWLLIQRYRWKKQHRHLVSPVGLTEKDVEADGSINKAGQSSDSASITPKVEDRIPTFPKFNPIYFAVPAICDVVNTCVQYTGLTLTSASSYQMLRGASILFTGILAVLILKNRLQLFKWCGMCSVTGGLVVIGVADIIWADDSEHSSTDVLVGDLFIIAGEVIHAFQVIIEQKLLNNEDARKDVPALLAVGLEGFFGLTIMVIIMIPMYFIHVNAMFSDNPEYRLEDAINAFYMMQESSEVVWALVCNIVSIAFFNFAGLQVTKFMNATTRMVLDSLRTIVIWALSIPLFDQKFIPLQVLGFVMLIFGMFIYNDILIMPYVRTTRFYALIFPASAKKLRAKLEAEQKAKAAAEPEAQPEAEQEAQSEAEPEVEPDAQVETEPKL